MSKYTTEVRFICETYAGLTESTGYSNVEQVIENSRSQIFDFSYPIFDEAYKTTLESKILLHYYTREICEETVGLWKLRLWRKMVEIMPYYNQLYNSAKLEYEPFYDVDITRQHTTEKEGSQESTGSGTSGSESSSTTETNSSADVTNEGWNMYSDTPQGAVTNLENETYLTNATKDTNDQQTTSNQSTEDSYTVNNTYQDSLNQTTNDTENYLESVKGKQGTASYSKMLQEYRETFLNIDMMVIDELEDLFFGLW